jgi:predicted ATPase
MFTHLSLKAFKSFKASDLKLGPFTLLLGTNASGKSNVRDAFRFLNGVGRGYSIADILGEKYTSGTLEWQGVRGGPKELTHCGGGTTSLTISNESDKRDLTFGAFFDYSIEVEVQFGGRSLGVTKESLYTRGTMVFDSHPEDSAPKQGDRDHLTVRVIHGGKQRARQQRTFVNHTPFLTQAGRVSLDIKSTARATQRQMQDLYLWAASMRASTAFQRMRFLDLSPSSMRVPSLPSQLVLGDKGENLSSVLHAVWNEKDKREILLEWIRALTPLDVVELEFPEDQTGRILVAFKDGAGRSFSAYSASDGTLRFLAMVAALLGPDEAAFYFFEELDNGIHPTRLALLVQLIENATTTSKLQVVGSTHSPATLRMVSRATLDRTSLIYRSAERHESEIIPLLELPDVERILEDDDIGSLFEAGWFEDVVSFADEDAKPEPIR